MQTIGLIGGMSWHSTSSYYRDVNTAVERAIGGHASAPLLISSLDFAPIRACQVAGDWEGAGRMLAAEAARLERAGATSIAICTNLMHKVAPAVEAAIDVPLLHICDAIAADATAVGATTVGIVGTRWVMAEPFYGDRLQAHGIRAISPSGDEAAALDAIIWSELTLGIVTDASRDVYRAAIARLVERGAEAVVLSCTEIGLLIGGADASVPVIDSATAHARAIANAVLSGVTAAV